MTFDENFPFECLEEIFHHLRGSDLLQASLACPKWNDFIGSTKPCMEKIMMKCPMPRRMPIKERITMTVDNLFDRFNKNSMCSMKKMMQISKRKYTSLLMQGAYSEQQRDVVASMPWTRIISHAGFVTYDSFLDFLRITQRSIRQLCLNQDYGCLIPNLDSHLVVQGLLFPNLKSLNITRIYATHYDKLFYKCKNLESLTIKMTGPMSQASMTAIRESLKVNKGLKKLNLLFGSVFKEDFSSEISFKLTSFRTFQLFKDVDRILNLDNFLKTQAVSLETMEIGGWSAIVGSMHTISTMSRLKSITFCAFQDAYSPIEMAPVNWPQNDSVTELDLLHSMFSAKIIWRILKAFPNVEFLTIRTMTKSCAHVVSRTCRSLKKLNVGIFKLTDIVNKEFFLGLEEFEIYRIKPSSQQLCQELNAKLKTGKVKFE